METNDNKIYVNGVEVTYEEFVKLQNDPKVKLVEDAPGRFKVLQRLHG